MDILISDMVAVFLSGIGRNLAHNLIRSSMNESGTSLETGRYPLQLADIFFPQVGVVFDEFFH